MCRDILNTCVRNTEEAERNSQTVASGRGQGKGVWGLIEDSELAKTFKKDDVKKVGRRNYRFSLIMFAHTIYRLKVTT